MTVLFRTRHGSHLYGLAHAGSDEDWYTVIAKRGGMRKRDARQTIMNGLDSTVVDLSTFMHNCDMGVPQALEAMFSTEAEIDLLTDMRASYRINTANMVGTYKRTIKNFLLDDPTYKKRRHALRLFMNLSTALETGRFDPRLSEREIQIANTLAHEKGETILEFIERYI